MRVCLRSNRPWGRLMTVRTWPPGVSGQPTPWPPVHHPPSAPAKEAVLTAMFHMPCGKPSLPTWSTGRQHSVDECDSPPPCSLAAYTPPGVACRQLTPWTSAAAREPRVRSNVIHRQHVPVPCRSEKASQPVLQPDRQRAAFMAACLQCMLYTVPPYVSPSPSAVDACPAKLCTARHSTAHHGSGGGGGGVGPGSLPERVDT